MHVSRRRPVECRRLRVRLRLVRMLVVTRFPRPMLLMHLPFLRAPLLPLSFTRCLTRPVMIVPTKFVRVMMPSFVKVVVPSRSGRGRSQTPDRYHCHKQQRLFHQRLQLLCLQTIGRNIALENQLLTLSCGRPTGNFYRAQRRFEWLRKQDERWSEILRPNS